MPCIGDICHICTAVKLGIDIKPIYLCNDHSDAELSKVFAKPPLPQTRMYHMSYAGLARLTAPPLGSTIPSRPRQTKAPKGPTHESANALSDRQRNEECCVCRPGTSDFAGMSIDDGLVTARFPVCEKHSDLDKLAIKVASESGMSWRKGSRDRC